MATAAQLSGEVSLDDFSETTRSLETVRSLVGLISLDRALRAETPPRQLPVPPQFMASLVEWESHNGQTIEDIKEIDTEWALGTDPNASGRDLDALRCAEDGMNSLRQGIDASGEAA